MKFTPSDLSNLLVKEGTWSNLHWKISHCKIFIPLLVIGREIPRYLVDLSRCTSSENGVGGCWHVVIYSRRVYQSVCPGLEAGAAEAVPEADLTGKTIANRVVPSSDIPYHVDRGTKEFFFHNFGGPPDVSETSLYMVQPWLYQP